MNPRSVSSNPKRSPLKFNGPGQTLRIIRRQQRVCDVADATQKTFSFAVPTPISPSSLKRSARPFQSRRRRNPNPGAIRRTTDAVLKSKKDDVSSAQESCRTERNTPKVVLCLPLMPKLLVSKLVRLLLERIPKLSTLLHTALRPPKTFSFLPEVSNQTNAICFEPSNSCDSIRL